MSEGQSERPDHGTERLYGGRCHPSQRARPNNLDGVCGPQRLGRSSRHVHGERSIPVEVAAARRNRAALEHRRRPVAKAEAWHAVER